MSIIIYYFYIIVLFLFQAAGLLNVRSEKHCVRPCVRPSVAIALLGIRDSFGAKCHFACRHAKNFIIFQSMDQKFAWGHAKSHESRAKYLAQGRTNTDGRFNSGLLWNYGGRNSSPCDSSSHALLPIMRFLQSCGSSSITLSRFAAEPWSRTPPTSHLCSSSIYYLL